MLNLDDPQAPYIVAAALHCGRIFEACKYMTRDDSKQRLSWLHGVESEFAALRWLNEHRFGRSAEITASIAVLEREVSDLARRELRSDAVYGESQTHCPACSTSLEVHVHENNRVYCTPCFRALLPAFHAIESSEAGFGTWVI